MYSCQICRVVLKKVKRSHGEVHLGILGDVVQETVRGAPQSRLPHVLDQSRAEEQGLGRNDDAGEAPVSCKMDRSLQTARPHLHIGHWWLAGVGDEHDRVYLLLDGQEDADLGGERGEDDGPITAEAVDFVEGGVDEGVDFNGDGCYTGINRFVESGILWS